MYSDIQVTIDQLPGLNCGLCGYPKCQEFSEKLADKPGLIERCIHLSGSNKPNKLSQLVSHEKVAKVPVHRVEKPSQRVVPELHMNSCGSSCTDHISRERPLWKDFLDRDIDFYLEHFSEDPGPREVCLPHNPILTREIELKVGDILIGRPLGMSCGCPITHCGIVKEVDMRTGVYTWCVTGPLNPREKGYKDIGYYIAEAYEGIVKKTQVTPKIGMRYYFQPTMCMLQWRHSGLVNYVNKMEDGWQIRLEGLYIG